MAETCLTHRVWSFTVPRTGNPELWVETREWRLIGSNNWVGPGVRLDKMRLQYPKMSEVLD